ncbi:hypothetical protein GTQ40_15720 [Flavobacteriaceae bacterium R38]|nr:hypothetical protein [Flavobacteriaceae bacterium R38]
MEEERDNFNDFVITEQSIHFNASAVQLTKDDLTRDEKVNNQIIQAANENIPFFQKENVRVQEYNFLLSFYVYKIKDVEYIITGDSQGISVYNFQFINKWLIRHDQLLGNYKFKIDVDIKARILNKAAQLRLQKIEPLATSIEELFNSCIRFHAPEYFNPTYEGANSREIILETKHKMRSWFHEIQEQKINAWNDVLYAMSDLFISEKPVTFLQIRDFITREISLIISDISKQGFQWGYSPFKDNIFKLESLLNKNYPDKKIKTKNDLIVTSNKTNSNIDTQMDLKTPVVSIQEEEAAKLDFEQIDHKNFLKAIIIDCLDNSKDYANTIWRNHRNDLKENYLSSEWSQVQAKFENDISNSYRNDNSVYRNAVKKVIGLKKSREERLEIIIDQIINHLNKNLLSFKERLKFIEKFEESVKESMLNEALFNHLKNLDNIKISKKEKLEDVYNLNEEEKKVIESLIEIKVRELNTFHKVRYALDVNGEAKQVTRVSFESKKLEMFLNDGNYSIDFVKYYLTSLREKIISDKITIYDYLPNETPDVTNDLINWIDKQLINIRLKKIEEKKKPRDTNKLDNLSNVEKAKIAYELIGDNKISFTSIVYHHIKDVLKKHKLTYTQGRDILLDMKGTFSSEQNTIIIEPIITYLERINLSNNSLGFNSSIKKTVKIPAKYYALYHWLLISLGIEKHFERNENDKYSKTEIENFAKERYNEVSSQMFYRSFIDIDITNPIIIAKSFGKGYKDKVIAISNNNAKVITLLKSFPN